MGSKKIVIGYDGSPDARTALAWALEEADRVSAPAEVFYADEWPLWAAAACVFPAPVPRPKDYLAEVVHEMLDHTLAQARRDHPLVQLTAVTAPGHPAESLIERSAQAGLLVIGGRGHSAIAGLLGSVVSAVAAHATCPVIVVRGLADPGAPVVAAIQDPGRAPAVLAFAADQASARKVALRVFRLGREPFDHALAAVRAAHPDLPVESTTALIEPAAALAEAGAQLLVVGNRTAGPVRGLLPGSINHQLLRWASCSIAVVHDCGAGKGRS